MNKHIWFFIQYKLEFYPVKRRHGFSEQFALPIQEGEDVLIRRSASHLNLIHPKNYSYFNTLQSGCRS
jgi:NAD kinase